MTTQTSTQRMSHYGYITSLEGEKSPIFRVDELLEKSNGVIPDDLTILTEEEWQDMQD